MLYTTFPHLHILIYIYLLLYVLHTGVAVQSRVSVQSVWTRSYGRPWGSAVGHTSYARYAFVCMCLYFYTLYYIVYRYLRIILLYYFKACPCLSYTLHTLLSILYYTGFAQAWRRAGDALGDLRQYTAAIDYYDVAVRLDPTLGETLLSNIGKR